MIRLSEYCVFLLKHEHIRYKVHCYLHDNCRQSRLCTSLLIVSNGISNFSATARISSHNIYSILTIDVISVVQIAVHPSFKLAINQNLANMCSYFLHWFRKTANHDQSVSRFVLNELTASFMIPVNFFSLVARLKSVLDPDVQLFSKDGKKKKKTDMLGNRVA